MSGSSFHPYGWANIYVRVDATPVFRLSGGTVSPRVMYTSEPVYIEWAALLWFNLVLAAGVPGAEAYSMVGEVPDGVLTR